MTMAKNGISKEPYEILEDIFANYIGTTYAVACNTGTAALTLACAALNLRPGDEIIVPEFTMIASAWAVTYNGAKPIFVDCGDDLNIDPKLIEAKITPKTKAIMVTHVYGRPANMKLISEIASKYHLPIIEDACEAHGAKFAGRKVGTFFGMGCFSFYKNKIVHGEEGGIITTNNEEFAERMQDLRNMSFGGKHDYYHDRLGFNFRMTNTQAELILESLQNIHHELARRESNRRYLDRHLAQFTLPRPEGSVMWVYDMVFEDYRQKYRMLDALSDLGIAVRPFFKPMSVQGMYKKYEDPIGEQSWERLKAHKLGIRGLYVPVNATTSTELDIIINTIKKNL